MLFTPASLHSIFTRALLQGEREPDGRYVRGAVGGKEYAISTYTDAWHRRKDELSRLEILRSGDSIIDVAFGKHDAVITHPRSLPETGNYSQRIFLESLVKLLGTRLAQDTPVVFTTEGPRLVTPKDDPWLQAIFEDLRKR